MNRRAGSEIAKTISIVPVLVIIIIIVALFLFLTVSMKAVKRPDRINDASAGLAGDTILFTPVDVGGSKYSIVEGALLSGNRLEYANQGKEQQKKFYDDFTRALVAKVGGMSVASANETCFVLSYSNFNYWFIRGNKLDQGNKEYIIQLYKRQGALQRVPLHIDGKEQYIEYYHGRCLRG